MKSTCLSRRHVRALSVSKRRSLQSFCMCGPCTCMCPHSCVCTVHAHVCMYIHVDVCAQSRLHMSMRVYVCTFMHVCMFMLCRPLSVLTTYAIPCIMHRCTNDFTAPVRAHKDMYMPYACIYMEAYTHTCTTRLNMRYTCMTSKLTRMHTHADA